MENKPVFYHSQHIELWNWLSKNPLKSKQDYFIKFGLKEPFMSCYACDAVKKIKGDNENFICDCEQQCPLDWDDDLHCLDSYYGLWDDLKYNFQLTENTEIIPRIIETAKIIRDLPLRKNVNDLYRIS